MLEPRFIPASIWSCDSSLANVLFFNNVLIDATRRKVRLFLGSPFNAVVIVVEIVLCPYWAARTDTLHTFCSFFALSSRTEESAGKLIYIVRWAATIIAYALMVIFIGIWNFQLPHLFGWTVICVIIKRVKTQVRI